MARAIEEWASRQSLRFVWGKGKVDGSFVPVLDHNGQSHYPIALYGNGWVEVQFQWLMRRPPFDDLDLRRELLRRLNEVPGVSFADDAITRRPSIRYLLREHRKLPSPRSTVPGQPRNRLRRPLGR